MKEVPDEPFPRANNVVGVGIVVYLPRFLKQRAFQCVQLSLSQAAKTVAAGPEWLGATALVELHIPRRLPGITEDLTSPN